MKFITALFFLLMSNTVLAANPTVLIDTNKGQITLELYPNEAPKTVENFLTYIQKDQFKGTVFHRVIDGFMIQGGGFLTSGQRAETLAPIKNESTNGLSNKRGTIAMARTNSPHSASRQFFINQKDNSFLDAKGSQWGYAVFGKVTEGLDVVDSIAKVQTTSQDKPLHNIIINSIVVQENQE
ncbi:peptidylprolyl isomerase [Psychromonas sp. 14N.309.X.WAT.B.A12]|nr:peptidylprolyl isomerase [Psychromonas sp. 14N.309.X.WAT.B.A12]MDN2662437.1 peptidylprolyl isomerase [Psychromonas sp. 14N.309.X.WAT.B.A12]